MKMNQPLYGFAILAIFLTFNFNIGYSQTTHSTFLSKAEIIPGAHFGIRTVDGSVSNENVYMRNNQFVSLNYTTDDLTDVQNATAWSYEVVYKFMNTFDSTQSFTDTLTIQHNDTLPVYRSGMYYDIPWNSYAIKIVSVCGKSGIDPDCIGNPETYPLIPSDIELEISVIQNKMEAFEGMLTEGVDDEYNEDSLMVDCKEEYENKLKNINEEYNYIRNEKLGEAALAIGYTQTQIESIVDEIWQKRNALMEELVDSLFQKDTMYINICAGNDSLTNDTANINPLNRLNTYLFKEHLNEAVREGEFYIVQEFSTVPEVQAEFYEGLLNAMLELLGYKLETIFEGMSQDDPVLAQCYMDSYVNNIGYWMPFIENYRDRYIAIFSNLESDPNFNDSLYWLLKKAQIQALDEADEEYTSAVQALGEYMYIRCGYSGNYYNGCNEFYQNLMDNSYMEEENLRTTIKAEMAVSYNLPYYDEPTYLWGFISPIFYSSGLYAKRDSVNMVWATCTDYYSPDFWAIRSTAAWLDWYISNMPNEIAQKRRDNISAYYMSNNAMPDSIWWQNQTDSLILAYKNKAGDDVARRVDSLSYTFPSYATCFDSTGIALLGFYENHISTYIDRIYHVMDSAYTAKDGSYSGWELVYMKFMLTGHNDSRFHDLYVRRDSIQQERNKYCIPDLFKGFPESSYFDCSRLALEDLKSAQQHRENEITALITGGPSTPILPAGWNLDNVNLVLLYEPFTDEFLYRLDSNLLHLGMPCFEDSLQFELLKNQLYLDEVTKDYLKQHYLIHPLDSLFESWMDNPDSTDFFYDDLHDIHSDYAGKYIQEMFARLPQLLVTIGVEPDSCLGDSVLLSGQAIFENLDEEFGNTIDAMLVHIDSQWHMYMQATKEQLIYFTIHQAAIERDYKNSEEIYASLISGKCSPKELAIDQSNDTDEDKHNAQVEACRHALNASEEQIGNKLFTALIEHVQNAFGEEPPVEGFYDDVFDLIGRYLERKDFTARIDSLDSSWVYCNPEANYPSLILPNFDMLAFVKAMNDRQDLVLTADHLYISESIPNYTNNRAEFRAAEQALLERTVERHMEEFDISMRNIWAMADSCINIPPDSTRDSLYAIELSSWIDSFDGDIANISSEYPSISPDVISDKIYWLLQVLHSELNTLSLDFIRLRQQYADCGEIIEAPNTNDGPPKSLDIPTVQAKKLSPVALRLPGDPLFLTPVKPTLLGKLGPKVEIVTESGPCGPVKYVRWNTVPGAVEYDLEWVYIDNWVYVNNVMANNAANMEYTAFSLVEPIRVTLKENKFPFPGEYPDGKLYFRVRGVSRVVDNTYNSYYQPQFLPWGYNWQGYNVSSAAVSFITSNPYNNTFENNLNWQWESTYAEEGKFKRVISYYDGMNRSNQTVTHMSTDNLSVIGETLYDHEGRAAVQVLPYPEQCYELSYRHHTREDNLSNKFDKADFELDNGVKTMNNSVGASEYYSTLNPFMALENPLMAMGSIPDANLFPYSQTIFMLDKSGRQLKSGGVGVDHKIGSGKETKYFYANASETELRRLFGKNIGIASHYKKNLVMDANGQLSVAYVDQEGRSIATALAGIPPTNVLELDSYDPFLFTQNITQNNIANPSDNTWEIVFHHANEMPNDELTVNYEFGNDQLIDIAVDALQGVCILCEFDLSISISDPDGNPVTLTDLSGAGLSGTSTAINVHIDNSIYQFSDPCAPTACSNCNISFKAFLPEVGTYTIHKKLIWDEEAAFNALNAALNPTVNTYTAGVLEDMVEDYVSQIDSTDCDLVQSPGFASIPEEAAASITAAAQTECRAMLLEMISQTSPWTGNGTPPIENSGIYYDNSTVSNFLHNNRPTPANYDPNHVPAQINPAVIPNDISVFGIILSIAAGTAPFEWKEEIAKAHPEYCWYKKCMDYSASTIYIVEMSSKTDLTEGRPYRDPQNQYGSVQAPFTGPNSPSGLPDPVNDPEIGNHTNDAGPNGESIWELANLINNNYTPTADRPKAAWQTFRGGYVQARTDAYYTETSGCPFLKVNDEIPEHAIVKPPLDVEGIMDEAGGQANIWNANGPMCQDICDENARAWISQLYVNCGEPFINTSGTYVQHITDPDMAIVMGYLRQYCISQCGPQNPFAIITQTMLDNAMASSPGDPIYKLRQAIEYFNTHVAGENCAPIQYNSGNWSADFVHEEGEYTSDNCQIVGVTLPTALSVMKVIGKLNDALITRNDTHDPIIGGPPVMTPGGSSIFFNTNIVYYPGPNYNNNPANCIDMGVTACEDYGAPRNAPPVCSDCSIAFFNSIGNNLSSSRRVRQIINPDYANITFLPNGNIILPVTFRLWNSTFTGSGADSSGTVQFSLTGCCRDTICAILPVPWETNLGDTTQTDGCIQTLIQQATQAAHNDFEQWLETYIQEIWAQAKCQIRENMYYTYTKTEHHYTLYYYDQANNLVQTVPPEGVHPLELSAFNQGVWNGVSNPQHDMESRYKYNSLEVAIQSETPDGGLSYYKPDALGRPNESRNAQQRKQAADLSVGGTTVDIFSKTEYDHLGRIKMVYEQKNTTVGSNTTIARTQLTETLYDTPTSIGLMGWIAANTRNRIASTRYRDTENGTIRHAYHYSYDIHGNVKSFITDVPALSGFGAIYRYRQVDYYYDLVSGKVNQVHYQRGKQDQFFWRYSYDGDNRLILAESSRDYQYWERDAKYFYYPHGPLKRTETGQRKVQGSDYFYTIHGWMKGVNAGALNEAYDVGHDGDIALTGNPNKLVARDAYGFTLDYYKGDYSPVGGSSMQHIPDISSSAFETAVLQQGPDIGLFNGNIVRMSTALRKIDETRMDLLGNAYQYDQLHRIRNNRSFVNNNLHTTNSWNGISSSDAWSGEYTYDANGNIMSLSRHDAAGTLTDNFTSYEYDAKTGGTGYNYVGKQNRLNHIIDAEPGIGMGTQSNTNYTYDEIGNLIKDEAEEIAKIEWTVYGKVAKVIRTGTSTKPDLDFFYDATGKRYLKVVKPKNTNGSLKDQLQWLFTYYQHDAQGNVLAIYDIKEHDGNCGYDMYLSQHLLYGSSRLGTVDYNKTVKLGGQHTQRIDHYRSTPFSSNILCMLVAEVDIKDVITPVNPGGTVIGTTGGVSLSTFKTEDLVAGVTSIKKPILELAAHIPGKVPGKVPVAFVPGRKRYEFSNHLNNVLVTISDMPIGKDDDNNGIVDYYLPNVLTVNDYEPFGMNLNGRTEQENIEYRFGFNGKENINEISNSSKTYDFGERIYSPNTGKWLSIDPMASKYSDFSPYNFAINNPIIYRDYDGRDIIIQGLDKNTGTVVTYAVLESKMWNGNITVPAHVDPITLAPIKYPIYRASIPDIGSADAISLDYTGQFFGFLTGYASAIYIPTGKDAGVHFYIGSGYGPQSDAASIGLSFGSIDFNENSGNELNRQTFTGKSQSYSASVGIPPTPFSVFAGQEISFTDGQYYYPTELEFWNAFKSDTDLSYRKTSAGVSFGIGTPIGGSYMYTNTRLESSISLDPIKLCDVKVFIYLDFVNNDFCTEVETENCR